LIFNNGLIIAGILSTIFGLFLVKVLPGTKLSFVGIFIFIIASISLIGVGVYPETVGDVHIIVSIMFFTLTAVAILIIGIATIKSSIVLGIILILSAFIVPIVFFMPWPGMSCAIAETIGFAPVVLFDIIFGIRMLSHSE
jgi:hypothetical membrane protein